MVGVLYSRICEAIRTRRVIRFCYAGGMQTVEPHSYGVTAAGEECLIGYQTDGYSTESRPHGWCAFDVVDIEGLVFTDRLATDLRPGHPEKDSLATVYACVDRRSVADRREGDQRSGVDRRQEPAPIDFPDRRRDANRRKEERRSSGDRRGNSD